MDRDPALTAGADGGPRYLSRGYQGAVYVTGTGPDRVVIKQATGRGLALALRRYMLRREYAAYLRIAGLPGIPRCLGLREDGSLVLEYIDGAIYRDSAPELKDRPAFFADLLRIILALHGAGVAHADLKRRGNILIGPDGGPRLVDFGSAQFAGPGAGPLARGLFRLACRMDLNAWVKLKYKRRYEAIEPADRPYYAPTFVEGAARVIRRAWRKLTGRQWRKARRRRRAGGR